MPSARSVITILLAFVVTACGGSTAPQTTAAAPVTTTTTTTTPATTTTTTTTTPETTTTTTVDLAAAESVMRAQIAEMILEVQRITGKTFDHEPAVIIGTPTEMRDRLEELIWEDLTEEDLRIEKSLLVALGVIEPTRDWVAEAVESSAGGVVGFYDPDTEELWVTNLGKKFGPYALSVVIHELHHALQDQTWDLSTWDVLWDEGRWEEYEAMTMLIEGEARFVEDAYINTFTERDRLAYNSEAGSFGGGAPQPALLQFVQLAYYKDGRGFVGDLHEAGGWAAVDAVWQDPPTTTEQAKHTDRYLDREAPIVVDLPSLTLQGFEVVEESSWGENDFIGMFAVEEVGATGVFAATNWGGDEYQVLWNGETAIFVLEVVGDDAAATANFLEALTAYRDNVGKGEDVFAVWTAGGSVYVVASEDPSLVATVVALLP